MIGTEVDRGYPEGADIVARAAWINIFGETTNGGVTPTPQREFLKYNSYNPVRRLALNSAKYLGPHLLIQFIGEKFGWNPAVSAALSVVISMAPTYLRTMNEVRFIR